MCIERLEIKCELEVKRTKLTVYYLYMNVFPSYTLLWIAVGQYLS